jgi:hypothetical protein
VKRLTFPCLALVLALAVMIPTSVSAGEGEAAPDLAQVAVITKIGAKGSAVMQSQIQMRHHEAEFTGAAEGVLGKPVKGQRYAILVGISDYPGTEHVLNGGFDLSYADDDAQLMYETLVGLYGFPAQNVALFTDTQATRSAIMAEIDRLKKVVKSNDEVVFYFSGHGVRSPGLGAPLDGRGQVGITTWGDEEYPIPGFGYIWEKELDKAFKKIKAERQIFIFDCCASGDMLDIGGDGSIVLAATSKTGLAAEFGEDYAALYDDPSMMVNHGLFTYFLAGLGMQYSMGDVNPADGVVTVEEAFDVAYGTLANMSQNIPGFFQVPMIRDRFHHDLLP